MQDVERIRAARPQDKWLGELTLRAKDAVRGRTWQPFRTREVRARVLDLARPQAGWLHPSRCKDGSLRGLNSRSR
jgi:hypothetical protein